MEEELDGEVFERRKTGMYLTSFGHQVLEDVREIIERIQHIEILANYNRLKEKMVSKEALLAIMPIRIMIAVCYFVLRSEHGGNKSVLLTKKLLYFCLTGWKISSIL